MNRLEQLCLERGWKMNDKRRAILQVIEEARDHPSVEQIYRRALQKDRAISLATVYRTIAILANAGLLTRLDLGDGKTRYEEASDEHHEHLLDVRSGAVVEFQSADIEALVREAAECLGYDLLDYRLEVFGEPKASETEPEVPPASAREPMALPAPLPPSALGAFRLNHNPRR